MSQLVAAMEAGDVLGEAERRYELIARMMDPGWDGGEGGRGLTGTEMKALSIEADRLIHKIMALRAEAKADAAKRGDSPGADERLGKVVQFDADRFRKSS